MQGVTVFHASGFPLNGAGEFVGSAGSSEAHYLSASGGGGGEYLGGTGSSRKDAGNQTQSCRQDAICASRAVLNAARPCSAALRRMAIVLSASLPGVALGNPLSGIEVPQFFGLPLLGSISVVLLMLLEPDTRRILLKAPRRCAVTMLVGLFGGAAVLGPSDLAAALLSFAAWPCFLVLLWGFIESALGNWDRPRATYEFHGAGAGGPRHEAELKNIVANCRRARFDATRTGAVASTSSCGDSPAWGDDLDSMLDGILCLPNGLSIPAPLEVELADGGTRVPRAGAKR